MSTEGADVAGEVSVPIYFRVGADGDLCHVGDMVGRPGQDQALTRQEWAAFLRECADIVERGAPDSEGGS